MANGSMGGIPALSFLSGLGGGLIQAKQYANQLLQQQAQNKIEEEKAQYDYLGNVNRGSTAANIRATDQLAGIGVKTAGDVYNDAIKNGASPQQAALMAASWQTQQQGEQPTQQAPGQPQSQPLSNSFNYSPPNSLITPSTQGSNINSVQGQQPAQQPMKSSPVAVNATGMDQSLPLVGAKIYNQTAVGNQHQSTADYTNGAKTANTQEQTLYTKNGLLPQAQANAKLIGSKTTGQNLTNTQIVPTAKSKQGYYNAAAAASATNAQSGTIKAQASMISALASQSNAVSSGQLRSAEAQKAIGELNLDGNKFSYQVTHNPSVIHSLTEQYLQAVADKNKWNAAPPGTDKIAGYKEANNRMFTIGQQLKSFTNQPVATTPSSATVTAPDGQEVRPLNPVGSAVKPINGANIQNLGSGVTFNQQTGEYFLNGQPYRKLKK